MTLTTRTQMENAPHPVAVILWESHEDGLGWQGEVTIWDDPNTRRPDKHSVGLRQSIPLGGIYVAVDEFSAGAWAYGKFDGTGLSERDLQWAALYAIEALKRKAHHLTQSQGEGE